MLRPLYRLHVRRCLSHSCCTSKFPRAVSRSESRLRPTYEFILEDHCPSVFPDKDKRIRVPSAFQ